MVNYSNSSIYKLCCKDIAITEIYIGSTTNFKRRKCCHKTSCMLNNKKTNLPAYQFIRSNGGFENWDMIQIEAYDATDRRHLETRERYWMELLKPSLNKAIPTRTVKEYHQNNKDIIKEQRKLYHQNNKDIIKKQRKLYWQNNRDIINNKQKLYRLNNKDIIKDKQKLYHQNNKDIINVKNKLYYLNNKESINKREKEKHNCECGSEYSTKCKTRHYKTIKHQFWLTTYNFIIN